jgi:stearoyl-CoA desaturase (delta-9 desaturase)
MGNLKLRLFVIHALLLLVFWTGVSKTALILTAFFFIWRGLFLSISYHRYFAHKTFKTSRAFQFFLALGGSICMQRGALWWAANHRGHHQHSDTELDPHSPIAHGFMHAHIGWALEKKSFETDYSRIKDFQKFPELKWLNERSDMIHAIFAVSLVALGELLRWLKPELGTNGPQLLLWVYLISGLAHLHTIFCVNSVAHLYGSRPYEFPSREGRDNSHNLWWLAWITFGEGWHYNHHSFPSGANLGIQPWEWDASFQVIRVLEKLGIVWDVKVTKPEAINKLTRKVSPTFQTGA